jgi:hypothetical protein
VDHYPRGSRLDADHPKTGSLFTCRFTHFLRGGHRKREERHRNGESSAVGALICLTNDEPVSSGAPPPIGARCIKRKPARFQLSEPP